MNNKTKKNKINLRYIPKRLTKKDKKKQAQYLKKSRKLYKKNIYFDRPKVSSYKSKTSKHILKARKLYGLNKIYPNKELAKISGCSINSLNKIVKKGQGAYYSSGSRPNQTSTSWGLARLSSALTSGKAAAVDYDILIKGCKKNSKGYNSAILGRKKYGFGKRKIPKVYY